MPGRREQRPQNQPRIYTRRPPRVEKRVASASESGIPAYAVSLRPTDFYTETHRAIFAIAQILLERGEPVDVITLGEELRRAGQLEFVGGPAALALLVEQASIVPSQRLFPHRPEHSGAP